MKIYKLLIDSPEMPKDTEARWNEKENDYSLFSPDGKEAVKVTLDDDGATVTHWLSMEPWQVENRPEFWELQEEKKEVENEFRCFIPTRREKYFCVDEVGNTVLNINFEFPGDLKRISQGVYRTERAAQMEALRRESMAKRITLSEGEKYFYVHLYQGDIFEAYKEDSIEWEFRFLIGNTHKTREDAQKWKDDGYWEAFNCLF